MIQRKMLDMVPPGKQEPPVRSGRIDVGLAKREVVGVAKDKVSSQIDDFEPRDEYVSSSEEAQAGVEYRSGWLGRRWLRYTILILAFFIVVFFVSLWVVPRVRVVITPKVSEVFQEFQLEARQDVSSPDISSKLLPAKVVSVSKTLSRDFSASGDEFRETKANGVVTITNSYSPSPQLLVRTTRLLSPDGKIFRTTETVSVPGTSLKDSKVVPGSISVEVLADKPGSEYNIGSSEFHLPGFDGTSKYDKIVGRSSEPMRGGAKGRTSVVTASDVESATRDIKDQLTKELEEEIKKNIPAGYIILEGADRMDVVSAESLPPQGEPAEKFRLQIKAMNRGISVQESQIRQIVRRLILGMFPEQRRISEQDEHVAIKVDRADFEAGRLELKVSVKAKVVGVVEDKNFREQLVGKKSEEVVKILKQPGIAQARLIFWPPWVSDFPKDADKISIKIQGN